MRCIANPCQRIASGRGGGIEFAVPYRFIFLSTAKSTGNPLLQSKNEDK